MARAAAASAAFLASASAVLRHASLVGIDNIGNIIYDEAYRIKSYHYSWRGVASPGGAQPHEPPSYDGRAVVYGQSHGLCARRPHEPPAISLFGFQIPCSGAKNSLFAKQQGNARNPLGRLPEIRRCAAKTGPNRRKSTKFPDKFPVLRENRGATPLPPLRRPRCGASLEEPCLDQSRRAPSIHAPC